MVYNYDGLDDLLDYMIFDDLHDLFDDLFGDLSDANYNDYKNHGLEPSLEAQIEKCVDDFKTGQGASCGINERELKQAMLDTQTGLLNCYELKIKTLAKSGIDLEGLLKR